MTNTILFSNFVDQSRQRVETVLGNCLPQPDAQSELSAAMRYSTLGGGKRIRALLAYATAEAVSSISCNTDLVAAAVELSHAYSLIHDDLPAMDNDDLRRGKPTCHKAYTEALAILAGDGLQALAFEQLANISASQPATIPKLVSMFAIAIGPSGMVGGQAYDITSVNKQLTEPELEQMHRGKTGALINASILMAAVATEQASETQLEALSSYGKALGLMFQVMDDILDVESDTQTLGKSQGADLKNNKPTYTSILGLEKARDKVSQLHQQAIGALVAFGDKANMLREIAHYIVTRKH